MHIIPRTFKGKTAASAAAIAAVTITAAAFAAAAPPPPAGPAVTTPAAVATPAPSPTPAFTPAQEQAIVSAEGYLSDGQGFSKAGLMSQLTSRAGDGFTRHLAAFAVNELHPDWMRQAVISARGYLSSGEGFSRASLIGQLQSAAGEGFTHAQAVHGANVALRG